MDARAPWGRGVGEGEGRVCLGVGLGIKVVRSLSKRFATLPPSPSPSSLSPPPSWCTRPRPRSGWRGRGGRRGRRRGAGPGEGGGGGGAGLVGWPSRRSRGGGGGAQFAFLAPTTPAPLDDEPRVSRPARRSECARGAANCRGGGSGTAATFFGGVGERRRTVSLPLAPSPLLPPFPFRNAPESRGAAPRWSGRP